MGSSGQPAPASTVPGPLCSLSSQTAAERPFLPTGMGYEVFENRDCVQTGRCWENVKTGYVIKDCPLVSTINLSSNQ